MPKSSARLHRLTFAFALLAAALAITAAVLNWTQRGRLDWVPILATAFLLALAWSARRKTKE
jgi:hypothetical protein